MDQTGPHIIEQGRLDCKTEFSQPLRLGSKIWQAFVRCGFSVIRIGQGSFVIIDDLLTVMRQQQQEAVL